MNLECPSIFSGCGKRSVQGAARVDNEQIAGRKPARQFPEARVLDRISLDIRNEQPHLVSSEATRLRWLGSFEFRRQVETGGHTRCSHGASSRWATNRSPLTSAG